MKEKFCKNCGSEILENAEFCGNCGAKLSKTDDESNDQGTNGMCGDENNSSDLGNFPNNDVPNSTDYAQVLQTSPKKKNTGSIIGIVAAVLLVFAFIGTIAERSLQGDENKKSDAVATNSDFTSDIDLDEGKEYVKGITTDTTYTSDFIGIRYEIPDGLVFASESELEKVSVGPTTWEMQAINVLDGSSVAVGVEKLLTKNISEDIYIASLKSGLEDGTLETTVSDIQESGTKMIAGKEYHAMTCTLTQNGFNCTQTYFLRRVDTYMVALLITSTSTGVDEMLSGFSEY